MTLLCVNFKFTIISLRDTNLNFLKSDLQNFLHVRDEHLCLNGFRLQPEPQAAPSGSNFTAAACALQKNL